MSEAVAAGARAPRKARHHIYIPRSLLIQPIVVLAVLAAYIIWLANTRLEASEQSLLNASSILTSTGQHLRLTLIAAVIVLAIGIPLGVLLTRGPFRPASGAILAVANFGQAAPAVGVVVLLAAWLGFNARAAILALVLYTILPVLRNTMIGIDGVNRKVVESARGMGMSAFSTLIRVELPLASPVILAGVRTALVLLVGAATLATFVGAGGLGVFIITGITLFLPRVIISGALLSALLALLIDWLGAVIAYFARPKGI